MKLKTFKSISAVFLSAVLLCASAGVLSASPGTQTRSAAASEQGAATVRDKNEVIYATLDAEGGVSAVYAVNHFELEGGGSATDHGDYASVLNLTDTSPLARDGDTVTFDTAESNFYYQGNMVSAELPWSFELAYLLDGARMSPNELGGKSGRLEIHIKSARNNGANPVFYENYLLQISLTLDTQRCADIKAPGATVAEAGKNRMIAYTVMPGKDADITVSADVADFKMPGVEISAMPYSMSVSLPSASEFTAGLQPLVDAISDLNGGVGKLAEGASELKTGAARLKSGSGELYKGLSELSGNSERLIGASSQINGALESISASLSGGAPGGTDLSALGQLPQGLTELSGGLKQVSGGLAELKTGFSQGYAALDTAMGAIPEAVVTEAEIAALYAKTDASQHALLDTLVDSYKAGQYAKGVYSQVRASFDAVGSTIDTMTGSLDTIAGTLDDMARQIGGALAGMDSLSQLQSGLSELADNYSAFHDGLTEYAGGVSLIAAGYADFNSGLSSFAGGIGELKKGADELNAGTTRLHEETSGMPDAMQREIDKLMDEYIGTDFAPVSFTSAKNTDTSLVQFVLKCEGIEKLEERESGKTETAKNETFWDRFTALFKGDQ